MPPVPLTETDGITIARLRSQQDMSRSDLADRVGCSSQLIHMIETGRINAATLVLRKIARVLDVSVSCLTYTGPLTLPERATTPGARKFALAAQQRRAAQAAARVPEKLAS